MVPTFVFVAMALFIVIVAVLVLCMVFYAPEDRRYDEGDNGKPVVQRSGKERANEHAWMNQ